MRPSGCFALAALLVCATPAAATGGFSCEIDDASLKFTAESALSHGLGAIILNFKAGAEVRLAEAPEDFRKLTLDGNLVHSWTDDGELRLHLYYERTGDKPHAYVEIVIKTAAEGEEGTYGGTYMLTLFTMDPPADGEGKTLTAEGKVSCFVE